MKLWSSLQDDLTQCLITGDSTVCIHHIFPNTARRRKCEKYGFVVAISPRAHEKVHLKPNSGIDLWLKQKAQTYFEEHYGSREDFIREFERSYL